MDQNQELFNLVERAKNGDSEAFSELYTSAYRTVYVTCNSYLKHPQEAEDLTQEVFIQIYNKLSTLDNNYTFYGWAKTIAMRLSLNRIRDNRDHASFDDAIANDEILEGDDNLEMLPDTYILKEEKRKIVQNILETELTDVQYQTILMHYFNEVPVENIAQIMECPEGTVKTRLKSARVKIKAAIEKYEQETGDRLIVANAIPSIAMVLKMSAASMPVRAIPFTGFVGAGAGVGVGTSAAKGAATAASKGAKAAVKGGATAAGGAVAKGVLVKIVGSILAVGIIGAGSVAVVNVINKEDPAPKKKKEKVVEEQVQTITFGKYEQDGDTSNGPEDIEWIVLDDTDDYMLLISKDALEVKTFKGGTSNTTWEDSSIRTWLNEDFYNEAFDETSKNLIMDSSVSADVNPYSQVSPGNATTDKVYLLSISEADNYFRKNKDRVCEKTPALGGDTCSWWLRTPGTSGNRVACINPDGSLMQDGNVINRGDVYVRPVIMVSKG